MLSLHSILGPHPYALATTVTEHHIEINVLSDNISVAQVLTRRVPNDPETDVEFFSCADSFSVEQSQQLHDTLYAIASLV